jgi:hypothetical protein
MGLLEYKAVPSLPDVAQDGVSCTLSNTVDQSQTGALVEPVENVRPLFPNLPPGLKIHLICWTPQWTIM